MGTFSELLGYPTLLFAVFAQFMYVGAQVGTWSYFIQYVQESTHQHEKIAGYLADRNAGGIRSWALWFAAHYALRCAPSRLMALYSVDQYCAGRDRRTVSRLGWSVGDLSHQLLHVCHVSHDLCAGNRRPRARIRKLAVR